VARDADASVTMGVAGRNSSMYSGNVSVNAEWSCRSNQSAELEEGDIFGVED
jgi:hypothetical protein